MEVTLREGEELASRKLFYSPQAELFWNLILWSEFVTLPQHVVMAASLNMRLRRACRKYWGLPLASSILSPCNSSWRVRILLRVWRWSPKRTSTRIHACRPATIPHPLVWCSTASQEGSKSSWTATTWRHLQSVLLVSWERGALASNELVGENYSFLFAALYIWTCHCSCLHNAESSLLCPPNCTTECLYDVSQCKWTQAMP